MFGAIALSIEPKVNSSIQMQKDNLRPITSLTLPISGIAMVVASWLMLKTQPDNTIVVSYDFMISGKATMMAVLLMEVQSDAEQAMEKIIYRFILYTTHHHGCQPYLNPETDLI